VSTLRNQQPLTPSRTRNPMSSPRSRRGILFLLLALAFVLTASSPAAAASPTRHWTPPLEIAEPTSELRQGGEFDVAFDGEIYFVASARDRQIVGSRIDADGELIDRLPLRVSLSGSYSQTPRVVASRGRFLVVWVTEHQVITGRFVDRHARLSPEFLIGTAGVESRLHVASDGRSILLVGQSSRIGRLIIDDGTDAPIIDPVTFPEGGYSIVSIASNGDGYLIAAREWGSFGDTLIFHLRRGDSTAELIERLPPVHALTLVARGSGYLLFSGGFGAVTARPLTFDGRVAGDSLLIAQNVSTTPALTSLSRGGDLLSVVWQSSDSQMFGLPTRLMMTQIDGETVEPPQLLGPSGIEPRLAGPASAPLLVWRDSESIRHGMLDLTGARLLTNDPTTFAAAEQVRSKAVSTPYGWFTVWEESAIPFRPRVRAAVINPAMARTAELEVSGGPQLGSDPRVAANERLVLVTWLRDFRDVVARRFTPTGEPLDQEPFLIEAGSHRTMGDAIWNGRYFLVSWIDTLQTVHVSRVTEEGLVLGSTAAGKVVTDGSPAHPLFARAGETTLLVWQSGSANFPCPVTCPPFPPGRIEGVRLSIEGSLIDPVPLLLSGPDLAVVPAVAGLEDRFLVAWRDYSSIRYRIVSAADLSAGPVVTAGEGPLWHFSELAAVSRQDDFVLLWDAPQTIEGTFISRAGERGERVGPLDFRQTPGDSRRGFSPASRGDDLLLLDWAWRQPHGGAVRVHYRGYLELMQRRRGATRGSGAVGGMALEIP
jgi:hypothetical protein